MTYTVKEIFYTLQGEGAHSGRPAVFVRFAGCNLWSGREQDMAKAICKFCDTDFVGGMKYEDASRLADKIAETWGAEHRARFVVFTGGEPLLQLDAALIDAVRYRGFSAAIETNGTIETPSEIEWVCVSPKAGTTIKQKLADELKLVFPQPGLDPEVAREIVRSTRNSIQPMDGPRLKENTQAAIAYVLEHPWWRLSLQTHKTVGLK